MYDNKGCIVLGNKSCGNITLIAVKDGEVAGYQDHQLWVYRDMGIFVAYSHVCVHKSGVITRMNYALTPYHGR